MNIVYSAFSARDQDGTMMLMENNGLNAKSASEGIGCSLNSPGIAMGMSDMDDEPGLPAPEKSAASWFIYLLECRHDTFYCGITNDLDARFKKHVSGKGARYTRANPPLRILATAQYPDRATASRAEYQLKQLKKAHKIAWINQQNAEFAQKMKVNQNPLQ